jgi:hypothetical protein
MKIKLKSNLFGKSIGDVVEISSSQAEQLIKSGDAEAVATKRPARKKVSNKAMSAKTE